LIDTGTKAAAQDDSYFNIFDEIYSRHLNAINELLNEPAVKDQNATFLKEKSENLRSLLKGINLTKEMSSRTKDCVCSYGELLSSKIIGEYFNTVMDNVHFLDSRKVVVTNSNFGRAKVNFESTKNNCIEKIRSNGIYVMGGFIAANEQEETTTLGRGGSDFTASVVAACCDAKELHIWTDVDGVMSADPRKVKKAFSINYLSYDEAMELSHFGAKVIYPPTIKPVLQKNIPIRIKNTFNPTFEGSLISAEAPDKEQTFPVKGISSISNISLLTLQGAGMIGVAGIAGRLFSVLAKNNISVILISQASSEHSICFAIDPNNNELAKTVIETEFNKELENGDIEPIIVDSNKTAQRVFPAVCSRHWVKMVLILTQ